MTEKLKKVLNDEIAFIFDVTEGEYSMAKINSMEDAEMHVEHYEILYNEDLPEALQDPTTMMMVWNYCAEQREKARIEMDDDRTATEHPSWYRIRGAYDDGSSAFFDPEEIKRLMRCRDYDDEHIGIVLGALALMEKTRA